MANIVHDQQKKYVKNHCKTMKFFNLGRENLPSTNFTTQYFEIFLFLLVTVTGQVGRPDLNQNLFCSLGYFRFLVIHLFLFVYFSYNRI